MGNCILQFTYLEPSEVRSWHPPTPASNKRVEMDRTVMPCGTVVTTITAVKSKPGRPLPLGLNIGTAPKTVRLNSTDNEDRVLFREGMCPLIDTQTRYNTGRLIEVSIYCSAADVRQTNSWYKEIVSVFWFPKQEYRLDLKTRVLSSQQICGGVTGIGKKPLISLLMYEDTLVPLSIDSFVFPLNTQFLKVSTSFSHE